MTREQKRKSKGAEMVSPTSAQEPGEQTTV